MTFARQVKRTGAPPPNHDIQRGIAEHSQPPRSPPVPFPARALAMALAPSAVCPSPSSPMNGSRLPRPWMGHQRLGALARLGRWQLFFAVSDAVLAQTRRQLVGELVKLAASAAPQWPSPTSGHPTNPSATSHRATGPGWLWAGPARGPFLTPPTNERPTVGRATGVTNGLAMPPQLPVRHFTQVLTRLACQSTTAWARSTPSWHARMPSPPRVSPTPFCCRAGPATCPREPNRFGGGPAVYRLAPWDSGPS